MRLLWKLHLGIHLWLFQLTLCTSYSDSIYASNQKYVKSSSHKQGHAYGWQQQVPRKTHDFNTKTVKRVPHTKTSVPRPGYNYGAAISPSPFEVGGCGATPPTPANAMMRCSQYSGCRVSCLPKHRFPNGETQLFVTCQDGEWQVEGTEWPTLPACEPLCMPACQNNGICVAPDRCHCPDTFSGPQCQFEKKPCLNYPMPPLNSRRTCSSTSCTVTCLKGYEFPDGSAIATMECRDGTWSPTRPHWVTVPDCQATCTPPCQNGGNCLSYNVCQCPQQYRGPQCQYSASDCHGRKLSFNGGYNCSGDNEVFQCSLKCPPGAPFSFTPASVYTCRYSDGFFTPSPTPQCQFFHNVESVFTKRREGYPESSMQWSSHTSFVEQAGTYAQATHRSSGNATDKTGMKTIPNGWPTKTINSVQLNLPAPTTCITWAGAHYKTFDGEVYSVESECAHTLVRDAVDDTFSVVVQNSPGCSEERARCHRVLRVYANGREYLVQLSEKGAPVLKTRGKRLPLPAQAPGLRADLSAHFVIVSLDSVGLTLKWDSAQLVQVLASEALWNRTEGMCGRANGKPFDDLLNRDGYRTNNAAALATSWQADSLGKSCTSSPTHEHKCEGSADSNSEAYVFCKKMLSDKRFAACHTKMDISMLMDACRWDYCACKLREVPPAECVCHTVDVFVRECRHRGVKTLTSWRDKEVCPLRCTGGRQYMSCGPAGGQPACGSPPARVNAGAEDDRCEQEEGCYCPGGQVLHDGACIQRDACPCWLRGKPFQPGDSVPKDCNTCTCTQGEWHCTQVACSARCSAVGDPHYTTFDGRTYDFMGQCSYYLVRTDDNHTVEAENVPCAGAISRAMNLPESVSAGLPACTRSVTVRIPGHVVKLGQNQALTVDGQELSKLPHSVAGAMIRRASSLYVVMELPNGLEIWWDGMTRVYIDAPPSFRDRVTGLCGTFTASQKDDFLTPEGDVEQSAQLFANKWKTNAQCADAKEEKAGGPCETNIQNKAAAEKHCHAIKSELFSSCHWHVDPDTFYQNCLYDMCSCSAGVKVADCLCPNVAAYAQECAGRGVVIEWRNVVRECGLACPAGQEYRACGDPCLQTCADLTRTSACKKRCVEGCMCPEGQVLNEHRECVPVTQCPCQRDGFDFPAGYKEVRAATKGQELCTCDGATWSCAPAAPDHILKYPKASDMRTVCSTKANQEFTTCEPAEPLTCSNMHRPSEVSPAVCHPGCVCKRGYVLDVAGGSCVAPAQCPCHHGGRSYADGDAVQNDCNTCTCETGKWRCTERLCPSVCSAWGDSHYKTFDGRLYEYQGQCDYLFAKGSLGGADEFDLSIQNVPCSTLGVSCSKAVTLAVAGGDSVTLTRGQQPPAHATLARTTVRQSDVFTVLEVEDLGLTLHWDGGTRVYLRLDARWKGKTRGLCGNYNDDQLDDFQTPSGGVTEVSAALFGDSWRLKPYCGAAQQVEDPCESRPERRAWAQRQCGTLKGDVFAACRAEVPVEPYVERCVFDTCACDQGGDCACLCTALAAYAHECNAHGVPVRWRTNHLCPLQCDERCSMYTPCMSSCPLETCDTTLSVAQTGRLCAEDTCIEGCARKPCPEGSVYVNTTSSECVPRSVCKPVCMEINGTVYYEGDLLEEDECQRCHCTRTKKVCAGKPCATTKSPLVPPAATTAVPPEDQQIKCVSGWTDWINQDGPKAIGPKLLDVEPLPGSLVLNQLNATSAKCTKDMMKDIACRTVDEHKTAKATGLNVECSLERGLVCAVEEDGAPCPDFEIRVLCECELGVTPAEPVTTRPVPGGSTAQPTSTTVSVSSTTETMEGSSSPSATPSTTPASSTTAIIAPGTSTTTVGAGSTPICDVESPNIPHPTNCQAYYHCVSEPDGLKLVENLCGPGTMYNPHSQVCDWPAAVAKLRPECAQPICPPGLVHMPCAVQCERLCLYYEYALHAGGMCATGAACEEGCVPEHRPADCPANMLWRDNSTCVRASDCNCRSNNGAPVQPGMVFEESACEICQCIDNQYLCDKTACASTPTSETTTSSSIGVKKHTGKKQKPKSEAASEEEEEEEEADKERVWVAAHSTVTPPALCDPQKYLYLVSGSHPLPDLAFTASSALDTQHSPWRARMRPLDKPTAHGGSWSPAELDRRQYLQIDLGQVEPVYGLAVAGSPLRDEYVTSYRVLHSPGPGHRFTYVTDTHGARKLFRGPIDHRLPVVNMFPVPFEAQLIRINPRTWHNNMALRADVIGCGEVTVGSTSSVHRPTSPYATGSAAVPGPSTREPLMCDEPMGLNDDRTFSDRQLAVSSAAGRSHDKRQLRLQADSAWQPVSNVPGHWAQFDLLAPRNVTGVLTKGGPDGWVSAYQINYSPDKKSWQPILDDYSNDKLFLGNFDEDTAQTNYFDKPVRARYIRILPKKWHSNIQMRAELRGCFQPYSAEELYLAAVEEVEVSTTPTMTMPPGVQECNYCPGQEPLHRAPCKCADRLWWTGEECVPRSRCPCMLGHVAYAVGSSFLTEECAQCICALGGVPQCQPKLCGTCGQGLRSVLTATCGCVCKPCPVGQILCSTSNTCVNVSSWCDGIVDCPDDELHCYTTTVEPIYSTGPSYTTVTMPSTMRSTTVEKLECPVPECPPGYLVQVRKPSLQESLHSNLMFRTTKTGSKGAPGWRHTKTQHTKSNMESRLLPRVVPTASKLQAGLPPERECPNFKCVSTKAPPEYVAPGRLSCPPPDCPPGYTPELDTATKRGRNCPTYWCKPGAAPPPNAVCNVTGRTINTFDGTEFKLDICKHVVARDLSPAADWLVVLGQQCLATCVRHLELVHGGRLLKAYMDLSLEYNGYNFSVEQATKIGAADHALSISRVGNALLFISHEHGFWVQWDKHGDVKVGVNPLLENAVDGLCGLYNGDPRDDKRTPDGQLTHRTAAFGDSWRLDHSAECAPRTCPLHLQELAWQMCLEARDHVFEPCHGGLDPEAWAGRCLESTCACLEQANGTDARHTCRCDALGAYAAECSAARPDALPDWRLRMDCQAECAPPLVYHDCYRRRCEPTCANLADEDECVPVPGVCFPGCYCPAGFVRHKARCVPPRECRDCECNVLPYLQYVTYDHANFTLIANCSYILVQHADFSLLSSNAPCPLNPDQLCVDRLLLVLKGGEHLVQITRGPTPAADFVVAADEVPLRLPADLDWLQARRLRARHVNVQALAGQLELRVYHPAFGVSLRLPSHAYGGQLAGLCGDCDRDPDNDMRTAHGRLVHDVDDFARSWQTNETDTCTLREDECAASTSTEDPCDALLDGDRFGRCHVLLDPAIFLATCRHDTCGQRSQLACSALETYAIACAKLGVCVDWHTPVCPPRQCPPGAQYHLCGATCPATCEQPHGCGASLSEGCFCADGTLLRNGTRCVPAAACEPCDDAGHYPGDAWQADACTTCTCDAMTRAVRCQTQQCPQVVCERGFEPISLPEEGGCCAKFVCTPVTLVSATCETPTQKPACGPDQLLKLDRGPDGCQQFICECRPASECDLIEDTEPPPEPMADEAPDEGLERVLDYSGCCPRASWVCRPEKCGGPKGCPPFYRAVQETAPGRCCPVWRCRAPPDQCLYELKYAPGTQGGERERTPAERDTITAAINSNWKDGPCRVCHCSLQADNRTLSLCTLTECLHVDELPDRADYVLLEEPVYNQCCPDVRRTACRDGGRVYQPGQLWTPNATDPCVRVHCLETDTGVAKTSTLQTCEQRCEPGSRYHTDTGECCGTCRQFACVTEHGDLKAPGDEWSSASDPCTKYRCVDGNNNTLQVHAESVNCSDAPDHRYMYERRPVPGTCCGRHVAVACLSDDGTVHGEGAQWRSARKDPCARLTCVRDANTGQLVQRDTRLECQTECPAGRTYQAAPAASADCCGDCVQTACVINGTVRAPGEEWVSPDGCTSYSCAWTEDTGGVRVPTVTSSQETCPDVSECPADHVYKDGCCARCNATAMPLAKCAPQSLPMARTLALVKQASRTHGPCANLEAIRGFMECHGACDSSTVFDAAAGVHESVCFCCQAVEYAALVVELTCEDGHRLKKQVAVPKRCSCESCAATLAAAASSTKLPAKRTPTL